MKEHGPTSVSFLDSPPPRRSQGSEPEGAGSGIPPPEPGTLDLPQPSRATSWAKSPSQDPWSEGSSQQPLPAPDLKGYGLFIYITVVVMCGTTHGMKLR